MDNSGAFVGKTLSRVAYYLELESGLGTGVTWVYVSMDAFTNDASQLAIPHATTNPVRFQQIVNNMNVVASANANVTTGTGIATGNIEMWPSNYNGSNAIGIPGANGGNYDFGDGGAGTSAGYGSFQVHNHGASETIFAYNAFGHGQTDGVGIGNQPINHPDWTFAQNANGYALKNLQILVQTTPFVASGGAIGKVAEVANYELIYELAIPNALDLGPTVPVPYTTNRTADFATTPFSRIAYYLELDNGGGLEWVYVSMDAFTDDVGKIGIPHPHNNSVQFQQLVSNMNVFSSAGAGVTTGTGITTGNIEIWPNNYATANAIGIPGANGSTYDIGDTINAGVIDGHGSFQVHNHGAGETIFGYNAFGNGSADGVGIGNTGGHSDWTVAGNTASYSVKNLQIFILPASGGLSRGAYGNVAEAAPYTLIFEAALPHTSNFAANVAAPYSVNRSVSHANMDFTRIAYYLELDDGGGLEWVYASMDAFTSSLPAIGLPHGFDNQVLHQQIVNNMNVFASAGAGVTTGTGIATGNIEMWPSNYGNGNSIGIPNADPSGNVFDFGDGGGNTGDGFGSFQVHNHGASEVIFAYNGFGAGNNSDLGIGTSPTGNPDWTFRGTAPSYTVRNLQILALNVTGLLSNDSDADGDPLSITGASTTVPLATGGSRFTTTSVAGADVTVFPDGSYIYDPTVSPTIAGLGTGENLVDTFTYLVDDGNGGTAPATVSITVSGLDAIENDSAAVRKSGPAITIDVLANDDPAPAAITGVTPNTDGGPGGLVTNNGNNITYDPNGQFNGLASGETAIDTFTYTTASGTAKVTITIEGSVGTVFHFR